MQISRGRNSQSHRTAPEEREGQEAGFAQPLGEIGTLQFSIAISLPAAAEPVDKRYMGDFEREGGEKKVGGAYASDEMAEGAEKEGVVVTMSDLKREWGV